jgi:hypothetical protein
MHQPGVPSDLDTPARMWARAGTLAVLAGAGLTFDEMHLSDKGIYSWWGGGSVWWRFTLAPGGEAVLVGQDSDGSRTHSHAAGDGPRDLLAGMPDRLAYPGLRGDLDDFLVWFAYWFVDGAWTRIDYPDDVFDDGLKGAVGCLNDDAAATQHALEMNGIHGNAAVEGAIAEFLRLAHVRAVDDAAVSSLVHAVADASPDFDGDRPDVARAVAVATTAGFGPAQDPPLLGDPVEPLKLY